MENSLLMYFRLVQHMRSTYNFGLIKYELLEVIANKGAENASQMQIVIIWQTPAPPLPPPKKRMMSFVNNP